MSCLFALQTSLVSGGARDREGVCVCVCIRLWDSFVCFSSRISDCIAEEYLEK